MAHNRKNFVVSKNREDIAIDVGIFSLLDYLPKEILILIGFFIQDKKDKATYAITCKTINNFFQPDLDKFGLYQSVIDDDRKTLKRILSKKPELLIAEPENLIIESQLTWQKFFIKKETAAVVAAKRKQITVLELMLPYYDKLEQTEIVLNAKTQALSAWKIYETKKNAQGEDEIVIPEKYAIYAKSLIDVFVEESFPNGSDIDASEYVILSEKTESALKTLFDTLLPKQAVRLDDYLDIELFLLAIYQAYRDQFNTFESRDQRNAFCVRVRGLIQSVLSPEMCRFFCEDFDKVVTAIMKEEKVKINKKAMMYELQNGDSFYRSSQDSTDGQGFNFFCGLYGVPGVGGFEVVAQIAFSHLENLCRTKTAWLQNLYCDAQNRKHLGV